MTAMGRVLLLTGPAGSGKTTLARHLSKSLGWDCISEDEWWVNNGWGSGMRTPEQEEIVQGKVAHELLSRCRAGRNALLEFILYKTPPNPLTSYQARLASNSIPYDSIALKPSVDEILKRLLQRGRASDVKDIEARRVDAENQVRCLEAASIEPRCILDPTSQSLDELCARVLEACRHECSATPGRASYPT